VFLAGKNRAMKQPTIIWGYSRIDVDFK